jgi:hypothetical protein
MSLAATCNADSAELADQPVAARSAGAASIVIA